MHERQATKLQATSLKHAYTEFMKARKTLRASTRKDYTRIFNTIFTTWHDKPLTAITKKMVLDRHQELTESRGKAHADLCMRFLRSVLNFAKAVYDDPYGRSVLPENPVRVLTVTRSWNKIERRRTFIKPVDLPRWYTAVRALRLCELTDPNLPGEVDYSLYETVADFLELLLFTGLRRQEALTLQWQDVDLRSHLLTIPTTKNGVPLHLPLSDHLLRLLAGRREAAINPYVFPGKTGHGYLIEPKRQMKKVVEASGVPFTAHDLRRTFITAAESLDISAYAIKRLVNHKVNNDVTEGYIGWDIDRLREPMQRITDLLLRHARGDDPGANRSPIGSSKRPRHAALSLVRV
ncbi:MAG: tyrosine-type recombinase/integrase [Gammaproteobacteria bacterium]|nr:tyrosine-type recombinase/integrase [Gammaproteobacteria bacterium]